MNIVLIANGLTHRAEHSYRLVHELRDALAHRGLGFHVYAGRSLDPEIIDEKIAIPHFKHSLYESVGPNALHSLARELGKLWNGERRAVSVPDEFRTWKTLNRSFRRDLESLPRDVCTAKNLLVVTAACQNQIAGVVDFLSARAQSEMPTVVCQLMFAPTWTPWGRLARSSDSYYHKAFQRAATLIGKKLFFTTENEGIAQIYRDKFGLETTILPIPFASARQQRRLGETVCLGFFGYSKGTKGFHLLPKVAEICHNEGLNVTFAVQVHHSGWDPEVVAAEHALRELGNIRFVEGALSLENYATETSKADAVLLPYDPVLFGMQGSGIFTECLTSGRPIIVSEGTFAAEAIKKGEAQGEVFAPYSAEACAAAIARLLPRLPECTARAAANADAFARSHSADAYVDVLLSLWRMPCPTAKTELKGLQVKARSIEGFPGSDRNQHKF